MLKVGDGRAEILILIKRSNWGFLRLERLVFLEMLCYSPMPVWPLTVLPVFSFHCNLLCLIEYSSSGEFPKLEPSHIADGWTWIPWRGTCASVYVPARCLRGQRQEGISNNMQKAKFGLFMLCHTAAVIPRQSICYITRSIH